MMTVGSLCLLSGIIGFTLPETKDQPMVDSISDLENMNNLKV